MITPEGIEVEEDQGVWQATRGMRRRFGETPIQAQMSLLHDEIECLQKENRSLMEDIDILTKPS